MEPVRIAKPMIDDEERAAVDRVLRERLHLAGAGGRRVRGRVLRPRRWWPLRGSELWDLRPPRRAARHWESGPETRSSCLRSPSPPPPTRCAWPVPSRSSPTSNWTRSVWIPRLSRRRCRIGRRRSCRCTSTVIRPTWPSCAPSRRATALPSSRTRPRPTRQRSTARRSARSATPPPSASIRPRT